MASFDDVVKGGNAVANVIAAGIIPAGLEMMDKTSSRMVEPFVKAGYDIDAEAILLCESDGTVEEVEEEIGRMTDVLNASGATAIACSQSEAERLRFWSGRKNAFPAAGRISPDYYCMDGTIPRKKLAQVLLGIAEMEKKYGLRCANVFHAGDGNLHPLILFDANIATNSTAPNCSAPRSWSCAWKWAAPSPANTAWASRRSTPCACSFHPPSARPSSS
jgi:glycolate oxidase